MVLPVLAAAKMASMAAGGASKLAGVKGKLNNIRTAQVGSGNNTRGQILGGYAMWILGGLLFISILGLMFWKVFIKEPRIAPTPMNNTRVSNREITNNHKEFMFSNGKRRYNNYKRNLNKMSGGNDFGGYYGIHPRGFSQGESRKAPVIGQNVEIDPAGIEEDEEEYNAKIKTIETRRQKSLSKTINSRGHNTGHIQQVSEINTATNLSSGNDFTSSFGRNNGSRNIQRYIQPLESRGVSNNTLNFASITK
jgi:hypothetical protein